MTNELLDSEISRLRRELDRLISDLERDQLLCEINDFFLDCPVSEWPDYDDSPLARLGGLACPYDCKSHPLENYDGEFIRRGAFSESVRTGIVWADSDHDRQRRFACNADGTLVFAEQPDGLYCKMLIPKTELGRSIVRDIARRRLVGFSVSFDRRTIESFLSANTRILCKAKLTSVSLVDRPAYRQTKNSLVLETAGTLILETPFNCGVKNNEQRRI
jgi:HK97 family phage prohead protease